MIMQSPTGLLVKLFEPYTRYASHKPGHRDLNMSQSNLLLVYLRYQQSLRVDDHG